MKLLQPKQLNDRLNEQKKMEIDAGLFLAKKIDSLRENLQETQKKHDDTISSLNTEFTDFTNEYIAKKGDLIKEIDKLTVIRNDLQKPLHEAWEDFHRRNDELVISENNLSQKQYTTSLETIRLSQKEEELNRLSIEVLDKNIQSEQLLQKANDIYVAQRKEGQELLDQKEKWFKQRDKEEKDIQRRKAEADNARQEYESYVKSIKQKERLLDLKLRKYAND